jgi:hypothetical protein
MAKKAYFSLFVAFPRMRESRNIDSSGLPPEFIPVKLAPAKAGGGGGSDNLAEFFRNLFPDERRV